MVRKIQVHVKKIDGQKSSDTFVKMDGQEIFRFAVKEVPKMY